MLVMTAKVDKKKIAVIFAIVVVAIAALILLLSGGRDAEPTASTAVSEIFEKSDILIPAQII